MKHPMIVDDQGKIKKRHDAVWDKLIKKMMQDIDDEILDDLIRANEASDKNRG